jgi:hypothetical protein
MLSTAYDAALPVSRESYNSSTKLPISRSLYEARTFVVLLRMALKLSGVMA